MVKTKKSGKKPASKSKTNLDNLNLKNKDYNLIKVKSSYLNVISISILLTVVFIVVLGYIIYYLNSLRNCDCFQKKNDTNVSNIDYLIIIESLGVAMNVILLINLISLYMEVNKIKSGGSKVNRYLTIIIFILVNLIVYGFFVYNVFRLSQNVDSSCECALHPIRYLLYLQALVIFVSLVFMVIGFFLI